MSGVNTICGGATAPWEPEDWPADGSGDPCCIGSAMFGPSRCTCWRPVYDLHQEFLRNGMPATREAMCGDCAFRPGSPERADEEDQLLTLPERGGRFYCHQGIRRPIAYRHPDGREVPGDPSDYRPPILQGRPFKADGTVADLCAGWAARFRAYVGRLAAS